jgi:hypothetical protein
MYHDQQLHQPIVDLPRRRRLYDEDILVPDGLANRDRGLLVGVVQGHGSRDFDAEPEALRCQQSEFCGLKGGPG